MESIEQTRQALEAAGHGERWPEFASLPRRYFDAFTALEVEAHAAAFDALTGETPLRVAHWGASDGALVFTICARDAPGLFSYLTGVIGARGLSIDSGDIFTTSSGIAIDRFVGHRSGATAPDDRWIAALEAELTALLRPLWQRPPDSARVRADVIELVAEAQAARGPSGGETLLPIEIEIDDGDGLTRVAVESQDTPFFLYSLSSALALQDLSIRHVDIATTVDRIRDVFHVTTAEGNPVSADPDRRRLQLSILVTKQFSHALDSAPDPRHAFTRFEELVRKVALSEGERDLESLLADPTAQRELARLLGASDFLWEDFIRLQYESILPLLSRHADHRTLSSPSDALAARLDSALAAAPDFAARRRALNEFKDTEAYLIDVDHILRRDVDFFFLSHRLTRLAELVIDRAFAIARDELTGRHGAPRSAAGLGADYAVFGLGKMGGSALGYASDIELLVIYSDHGETDGDRSLTNREFFEKLVVEATGLIEAKREGIFQIDLRLRPYGSDGPKAVHLDSFLAYFGSGGPAHSVERLALVRLRHVAGSLELGRRVVDIRDQIVYLADTIDVGEIRELRQRQLEEKASDRLNAKFSAGALVDLEYNVQLLQVQHGRTNPGLRDPGIHATLRGLSDLGTIDPDEAESMIRAYRFLRNLINALRMLRGNAQDLFIPRYDTREFVHLARRMGYSPEGELTAAEALRVDFEVETASVRSFVERHLGQDAIPAHTAGSPADLVLADSLGEEMSHRILRDAGFRNPSRGVLNLRRMAGSGETRELLARLIVLAWGDLVRSGDPDMALNNWERFREQVADPAGFFRELLSQPRRLQLMLTVFAGSQFLSDTLIRNPAFLSMISDPAVVRRARGEEDLTEELRRLMSAEVDRTERLNVMRRFRRREILRIGTHDICLAGSFREVVAEISALARAVVQAAFSGAYEELDGEGRRRLGSVAILAFGKLGGRELNYSSDIDLLAVYRPLPDTEGQGRAGDRFMQRIVRDLSDFTLEGQAYRVDLRLRPYGDAGRLAYALPTLERYYGGEAELWELQAAIKLGFVAGDAAVGRDALEAIGAARSRRLAQAPRDTILATVRHLRARAVSELSEGDEEGAGDVKNGIGGIRDIEFLVQALQMLYQSLYPQIVTGNTLAALSRLEEADILAGSTVARLRADYLFLRRIEHFLQVYGDRKLHSIPSEPEARAKLARIVIGDGSGAGAERLMQELAETVRRVHGHYREVVDA